MKEIRNQLNKMSKSQLAKLLFSIGRLDVYETTMDKSLIVARIMVHCNLDDVTNFIECPEE